MYRRDNKENEPVLKGLTTVIERSEKRLSTRHYPKDNRFDLPTRNRFVDGPVFFFFFYLPVDYAYIHALQIGSCNVLSEIT